VTLVLLVSRLLTLYSTYIILLRTNYSALYLSSSALRSSPMANCRQRTPGLTAFTMSSSIRR